MLQLDLMHETSQYWCVLDDLMMYFTVAGCLLTFQHWDIIFECCHYKYDVLHHVWCAQA